LTRPYHKDAKFAKNGKNLGKNIRKIALLCGLCVFVVYFFCGSLLMAQTRFLDLSKAANMGPSESFDGDTSGVPDADKKDGFSVFPTGSKTLRGVPFQLLDPSRNQGRSFVVLKGSRKPDFPEAVSIPAGYTKASHLYFLHTCRWGGTGRDVTVAEYNVIYGDGKVEVIPLRVGVELANFFGADDTSASFLAWWHRYKKIEMGVSLFPWKNPRPDEPIQSILFKSRSKMPVPILFAVTASERELTVADNSPKPEKEFRTDTTGWLPFTPSGVSSKGTAIDMSFLNDREAGAHGLVKKIGDGLVFKDLTEARFWGVELPNEWWHLGLDGLAGIADRLSILGCNLVLAQDPTGNQGATQGNVVPWIWMAEKMKGKGIYILWKDDPSIERKVGNAFSQERSIISKDDPDFIPADLIKMDPVLPPPQGRVPWIMCPENNGLFAAIVHRSFSHPFLCKRYEEWPTQLFLEKSLLYSAYSSLQGWVGSVGGYISRSDRDQVLNFPEMEKNQAFLIQWPIAALAFRRGDLKEGRTYVAKLSADPTFMESEMENRLRALAHRSGSSDPLDPVVTDPAGLAKARIDAKNKSFVSDTGQITWQGNVGVVKVESPRFQALIGFLAHRKFSNATWAVETKNPFASLSAISLTKTNITASDHILLTAVARMENTGQVYNEKRTKLLDPGKAPILREPVQAKLVLYRAKMDPTLKVRALDQAGQTLPIKVSTKWTGKNLTLTWVPEAIYLEVYKAVK
jgi:hypothetical protein